MMHFGNGRKGGMMGNRMLPMEPMYALALGLGLGLKVRG